MDNATNFDSASNYDFDRCDLDGYDLDGYDLDGYDLEKWLEICNSDESSKQNRRGKKRRKPLRRNRRPSRPINYIGQRSNNHLLRAFNDNNSLKTRPVSEGEEPTETSAPN